MTKAELYDFIKDMRRSFGFAHDGTGIRSSWLANVYVQTGKLFVQYKNLTVSKVGGILFKGRISLMTLNTLRTPEEQNFDCGHELLHFWLDPAEQYMCIENDVAQRQSYPEWRANEGSAELLIPHDVFIPEIVESCDGYDIFGSCQITETKRIMAEKYFVTVPVITHRINSLKYEIDQYRRGVPINNIEILSDAQQKARGIVVEDTYNTIERDLICIEDFSSDPSVCPVCGKRSVGEYTNVCDVCWLENLL